MMPSRERKKERTKKEEKEPSRRAGINHNSQLSCPVPGTLVWGRWTHSLGTEGAASERLGLCMPEETTGNYGWTGRGNELGASTWELDLGEELCMFLGHCKGFPSRIPCQGTMWSEPSSRCTLCALNPRDGARHGGKVRHPRWAIVFPGLQTSWQQKRQWSG